MGEIMYPTIHLRLSAHTEAFHINVLHSSMLHSVTNAMAISFGSSYPISQKTLDIICEEMNEFIRKEAKLKSLLCDSYMNYEAYFLNACVFKPIAIVEFSLSKSPYTLLYPKSSPLLSF